MTEADSKREESRAWDPKEGIPPAILAKLDPAFVELWTHKMNTDPPPNREQMTIAAIRADPQRTGPVCYLDTKGFPRTAEDAFASEDGAMIPVRIYYPDDGKFGAGPYPVHLNFHGTCAFFFRAEIENQPVADIKIVALGAGGGFVLGSLAHESTLCMSMCEGAGVVVIDVNYRHCPETMWGKCFQDAFAALKWV